MKTKIGKKIIIATLTSALLMGNISSQVIAKTVSYQPNSAHHSKTANYIISSRQNEKFMEKYEDGKTVNENGQEQLEKNDFASVQLTKEEFNKVRQDNSVKYVEPDALVSACSLEKAYHAKKKKVYKTNYRDSEWNMQMIHAEKRNKKPRNKIKVAVLDSGVDYGNDIELSYSVSLVPHEEEMNLLFMDGTGHGNSVAGLIAAQDNKEGITGVNPNAEIYSIRVLDDNNQAPLSRIIEGIYMAIDQHVNIINMSFGISQYSEALHQAIKDANSAGILLIAAAGNTGEKGVQYPAAFDEVMAVGSVDKSGNIAESSAVGEEVEIVAPGEQVRSTGEFGSELVASGTSLAAPQVTGVASLLWERDKDVSADYIRSVLNATANSYGNTTTYGNGLLDSEYSLKQYQNLKEQGILSDIQNRSDSLEQYVDENTRAIVTFEDTGCVEGSWDKDVHAALVGNDYKNVKLGARYPDIEGGLKGISNNPGWHGSYNTNYIAAYIYATKIAEQLGKGKSASAASSVGGLSSSEKANMLGDVNRINWNKLGMNSSKKMRAFVWGMAIHTAADVFAHSAFVKSKDIWCHLAHGKAPNGKSCNSYADKMGKYEDRFHAAENVVNRIVHKYNSANGAGSYIQFKAMSTVGHTFRLKDLSPFVDATNSSADLSGLTSFSISRGPFNYYWEG